MTTKSKIKPFHLVVSRLHGEEFIPEQFMGKFWTVEAIVADICAGHYEDVEGVFLIVPETGVVIDLTVSVMEDVLAKRLNEWGDIPYNIRGILEHHLGCRAVADAERSLAA